ncbi:hypothetical protein C8R46DRAFT_1206326 [Mycena filopes]|nr:hypothetical protein C8R46DRAFT_1206326 [Mycena filopes]
MADDFPRFPAPAARPIFTWPTHEIPGMQNTRSQPSEPPSTPAPPFRHKLSANDKIYERAAYFIAYDLLRRTSAALVSRLIARRLITRPDEFPGHVPAPQPPAPARTPQQAAGYAQMEAWMARADAPPELIYVQRDPQASQNLIAAWNAVTEAIIPALERLS